MSDFLSRVAVDWSSVLERVLAAGRERKASGLLVFDLDSTIFDNRPRQARIVREFGAAKNLTPLTKCQPFHFTSGWDLRAAVMSCGVSAADAEAMYKDLKAFWAERFFTSDYCHDDIEIVGAPRYLHACVATGAQVVYVTGRHEEMRAGSIAALEKCRMPVPGKGITLIMKPTLRESDDAYKRTAHQTLSSMGTVLAAFDNEPTHINDYAIRFEACLPVHLATDHSGRDVKLHDRVVSIPHFAW
ncbi:MAG: hypothetical protein JNG84_02025 [Archangium sp.]|nr:hypothetical protein [Archangium sp.]